MAGNTVTYNLKLNMSGFDRNLDKANRRVSNFEKTINGVRRSLTRLGVLFGGIAITKMGQDIIETTATMESLKIAIDFASGSAQEGAKSMQFLRDTSKDMGIQLFGAIQGFKQLSSSALGTGIDIGEVRQIFGDMSVGISALGLSSAEAKRIFLALGQMLSKGTVAAEELRRQLGDTMPGTMELAARSMGITVAEFVKLLETGKIKANEFVGGFAREVRKNFEGALPQSTVALRSEMNRLNTAMFELKNTIGTSFSGNLKNAYKGLANMAEAAEGLVGWLKENNDTLKLFGDIIISVGALLITHKALLISATIFTTALNVASWALTAAFGALSKAMLLTPWGWFIGIASVLAGTFALLWRRSIKFRGAMIGIGKHIQILGNKFLVLGKIIRNAFRPKRRKELVEEWRLLGEQSANAFKDGHARARNQMGKDVETYEDEYARMAREQGLAGYGNAPQMPSKSKASVEADKIKDKQPTSVTAAGIKTFNINIDKLIGTFKNQSDNLGQGKENITKTVAQVLMEALGDVQTVASNV